MIFIGGGSSNWKIKVERQVERQQLEVDGAKVSLRFWPGRGTPLVLLHVFADCPANVQKSSYVHCRIAALGFRELRRIPS